MISLDYKNENIVNRINIGYFYNISDRLHPLTKLSGEKNLLDILPLINSVNSLIEELFVNNFFVLTISYASGMRLLGLLKTFIPQDIEDEKFKKPVSESEITNLANTAKQFEVALIEEFGALPSYMVTPKGGYDVNILTLAPQNLFPPDLTELVPETKADVQQAALCIAFEVPTAAGFHLHRMNEQVMHVYWDSVADGKKRPDKSSVGVYLDEMEKETPKIGDDKVRFLQRGLQKLYRNPLIHQENGEVIHLNVQEALSLLSTISSAISAMLPAIRSYKESKGLISSSASGEQSV